eukprot:CAMPEP_0167815210 /NCGR_PEP_ID=MMETSP0112_2-20121227/2876_1 /TAXON_ID=91324 /ORGANISM="Lotharella globosa, Strain CCCM811" /LENGTH=360 /DNA_ID=CAMNT_0007714565 /DNA_START=1613 /DNA_END=2691 /DNA_ORIENTATION=+
MSEIQAATVLSRLCQLPPTQTAHTVDHTNSSREFGGNLNNSHSQLNSQVTAFSDQALKENPEINNLKNERKLLQKQESNCSTEEVEQQRLSYLPKSRNLSNRPWKRKETSSKAKWMKKPTFSQPNVFPSYPYSAHDSVLSPPRSKPIPNAQNVADHRKNGKRKREEFKKWPRSQLQRCIAEDMEYHRQQKLRKIMKVRKRGISSQVSPVRTAENGSLHLQTLSAAPPTTTQQATTQHLSNQHITVPYNVHPAAFSTQFRYPALPLPLGISAMVESINYKFLLQQQICIQPRQNCQLSRVQQNLSSTPLMSHGYSSDDISDKFAIRADSNNNCYIERSNIPPAIAAVPRGLIAVVANVTGD